MNFVPARAPYALSILCALAFAGCGDSAGEASASGETSTDSATDASATSLGVSESGTSQEPSGSDSNSASDGSDSTDGSDAMGSDATSSPFTTSTTSTDPTNDPTTDPTAGDGWGCQPDDKLNAKLTGTVWAPNGTIPVSGALVYVTAEEPEGIPQTVYCAECLELTCAQYHTFTGADGSFELDTLAGDGKYLVVQKGQFLRIQEYDIQEGEVVLGDELTTLPDHTDPAAGVYIPKIAIADGSYDRLEDAFGKFGLGDTMIADFEERLIPGTEPFDLWENGQDPSFDGFVSQGGFDQLVQNYALMEQYHVIFVPCSSNTYNSVINQPQVQQNIHDWVEAGGRWYVADWSNDWINDVFPQYQTFNDDGFGIDIGSYDSLGTVLDTGLLAWLEALPDPLKDINPLNDEEHPTLFELPQVQTVDNFSALDAIAPVLVDDGMGGQVDVGHDVWLEGPHDGQTKPLTVTGQYGCGKIQFTTYHAAEFFNYVGLSPQELVLFYTILEIGVCQESFPIPQ